MEIKIPQFSIEKGFVYEWENGFQIETDIVTDTIHIKANKEGLISLAKHLLSLAQDNVPSGNHIHLDEYNSLEEGSIELIIQKL